MAHNVSQCEHLDWRGRGPVQMWGVEEQTPSPRDSSGLWSRFWVDAARHGCTQSFPAPVQAAIRQGWMRLLSQSPGASLLDVACGRGAVLDHARAAGLTSVVGVDGAAQESLGSGDPDLRGGVDARRLPFADRSFDLVTSQYGIEYACIQAAALEAARVVRSTLILLVHAADGVIVRQAREQVEHATWIDGELGAFYMLRQAAVAPAGERATSVGELVARVAARAEHAENVALLSSFAQIATAFVHAPAIEEVDTLAIAWREHADRLTDLLRAAPDAVETGKVAERLREAGFAVDLRDEIAHDGGLIGRWIIARREEGPD